VRFKWVVASFSIKFADIFPIASHDPRHAVAEILETHQGMRARL